jgi:hypothetical protein
LYVPHSQNLIKTPVGGLLQIRTNPDLAPHYQLLELFAFGTWPEYKSE